MRTSDLSDLRAELADQAVEMDGRGFDPLPGARRRRHRIVLHRRAVAAAAGVALMAGLVTSLPEDAYPRPAPPVAGKPTTDPIGAWPAVKPAIPVGRAVSLSPRVTLRFESLSVVAITGPIGFEPGPQTVRRTLTLDSDLAHPGKPFGVQWLLTGPLPNGEAHALAAVESPSQCWSSKPPYDRVRIGVALDGQVSRSIPAEVHPLAFWGKVALIYLQYPTNGFAMTPENVSPRNPHGVFLTHTTYSIPASSADHPLRHRSERRLTHPRIPLSRPVPAARRSRHGRFAGRAVLGHYTGNRYDAGTRRLDRSPDRHADHG